MSTREEISVLLTNSQASVKVTEKMEQNQSKFFFSLYTLGRISAVRSIDKMDSNGFNVYDMTSMT